MLDHRSHRRTFGIFYTPASVAELMADLSLPRFDDEPITVLDPACGDGALLAAVLMHQRRSVPDRDPLGLIRDRIFGVDIDPDAVAATKQRLGDLLSPPVQLVEEIRRTLDSQIVCGDALTGRDFHSGSEDEFEGLNWRKAFPHIADHHGFDLIIANPPYRRERDSKPMFDRIAATPLGRRRRWPRMDLWHYFLHRGLDLLKPGGRLCFLVNSYWTKSAGAAPLIDRLRQETSLEEIVEFDALPIFRNVGGRHMILQLKKAAASGACRLSRMSAVDDGWPPQQTSWLAQEEMYHGGQLILQPQSPLERGTRIRLGDRYIVRQGIAENPPTINAQLARQFPGIFRAGEGVFVVTAGEVASLELNVDEAQLLRPYAEPSEIGRYRAPRSPSRFLLYLTPRTAAELSRYPHIARHLCRFRPILESRREVQKGSIAWWHLHWPRDERLFTHPRILHVQMGRQPTFAFVEQPLFVGFSINVVGKHFGPEKTMTDIPLPALTAILNSQPAAEWFDAHAKRRGVNLEISGTVLKQFPLPRFNAALIARLNLLSHQLHDRHECDAGLEVDIDNIVRQLYEI